MMYEGDGSTRSIYDWLEAGGYSRVLYWNGDQHAYVVDEDDDDGWQRVPVASARFLVQSGQVAVWRNQAPECHYADYRPKHWVEEWNKQYPPALAG